MRYIVTVIAALIVPTASYGQGTYIYSLGQNSCGKYLAAVHGHAPGKGIFLDRPDGQYYDDHFLYAEWLSGFLSAANWLVINESNQLQIDNAAIDVWIRKWCEQNPTKSLGEAAVAFVWDQRQEYLQSWSAGQQTR